MRRAKTKVFVVTSEKGVIGVGRDVLSAAKIAANHLELDVKDCLDAIDEQMTGGILKSAVIYLNDEDDESCTIQSFFVQ